MEIQTPQLQLVNCDLALIELVLQGNAALAAATGWTVPDDWTEFGEPAFRWTQTRLQEFPAEAPWYTYLPILRAEHRLVGSGGFTGKPNAQGSVEIGYEIAPTHRQRGLATELARALVTHAFSHPEVNAVTAHTLAEENPSTRVLLNCGLAKVAEIEHPEDGKLWRWEITREAWLAQKSN
jgi:[ribosomal protein S5]-alanine N-acetyltransferase